MHYDKDLNLVLWTDTNADCRGRLMTMYIPARHVHIIRMNLLKGKRWDLASPLYEITREQAAFIFTHPPYGKH